MDIRRLAVSKLNPAPYNPRRDLKPGDPEYERLVRSVQEFGLVEPLVWNRRTGTLVGGHQRLKVLIAQGATHADVSVVDLPIEREKALNVALNKISGAWDQDKLAELLEELTHVPDFDLELTGFDTSESDALIADLLADRDQDRAESFDVEEAIKNAGPPVTKPGDLIILGTDPRLQHRLVCGDSTDHAQVRRVMDGQRAILFATDPPYLVDYDGTNHPVSKQAARARRSKNAALKAKNKDWSGSYGVAPPSWDDPKLNPDLYERFIAAAVAEAIDPHAAWYCWHASRRQAMVEEAWAAHGAFVHQQIIWAKDRPVLNYSWFTWQHEPCFFGWVQPNKPPRRSADYPSTIWKVPTIAPGEKTEHPTSKPLELFEIPMRQHTRAGEVCYEPFCGSGSQLIAAERLGRRCYALEISPIYCDVIVRRFMAFAGERAVAPEIAAKYRARKDSTKRVSIAPAAPSTSAKSSPSSAPSASSSSSSSSPSASSSRTSSSSRSRSARRAAAPVAVKGAN